MNIINPESALSFCYLYTDIILKVIWILVRDFYASFYLLSIYEEDNDDIIMRQMQKE
jgi:hypothetical protein